MSTPAIRVHGLSKRYALGARERMHRTFREALVSAATAPVRRLRRGATEEATHIWALKDVSFDVQPGEVVGIIGRNGAGKSTLLKILSRITEPTAGRVELRGRISSLLEVGTGFHSELSGRENVYLNGAILGMTGSEIDRKFDQIVAFSELEKFIDTPVKHYSSGMYMRLAFAVAAHLEPEILLVDEVLAVGDVEFQNKCLGKMSEVGRSGKTILFVSHNLAAIEALCTSAIVFSHGTVRQQGDTQQTVQHYLDSVGHSPETGLQDRIDREGNGWIRFSSVTLTDQTGRPQASFQCGQHAVFDLSFRAGRSLRNVGLALGIDNHLSQRILLLDTELIGTTIETIEPGEGRMCVSIPRLPLMPGRYTFNLFCTVNGVVADWIKLAATFEVEAGDYYGSGRLPEGGRAVLLAEHSINYWPAKPQTSGQTMSTKVGARASLSEGD
jgi:lipopolysaccharide transport system ATP-binding protein